MMDGVIDRDRLADFLRRRRAIHLRQRYHSDSYAQIDGYA